MMTKKMWNDGPGGFEHFLTDPDCPVRNPNVCFGGDGGGAPTPPDYSQYIKAMTDAGNTGLSRASDLYSWAQGQGQALQTTANAAGQQAGTLASATTGTDPRLEAQWESTYGPLYQAQAADASRMQAELPKTEEEYAGKYAADQATALDQAKATQQRTLQGYGLTRPGVASQALDMASANQRAAATTAAAETGRLAARNEARGVTSNALTQGATIPQVGAQQAGVSQASNQQSVALPATAITTTAGAYSPSLGYYQASYPYMSQWGQTMSNAYNQNLAQYNANANAGGGTGALMGSLLGTAGTIAGAYFGGPAGAAAGGAAGSAVGKSLAEGGKPVDDVTPSSNPNYVPPTASPSRGAITDDVPARLNAGEFVLPKDVVSWLGEEKLQKLISGTRQKRQQGEHAKPEMSSAAEGGAIRAMAPTFVSEGARV